MARKKKGARRKASRPPARKAAKKSARKATKKAARKGARRTSAKAARKAPRKPTRKAARTRGSSRPGRSAVAARPAGFSTLTPHLVCDDCAAALEFYAEAFEARLHERLDGADGRVLHAELQIGDSRLMLSDDFPEYEEGLQRSPLALGGTPITLHLYVSDADATFRAARAAGCEVLLPLRDTPWGDRYGKLRDPFGHEWSIATQLQRVGAARVRKEIAALLDGESATGADDSFAEDEE